MRFPWLHERLWLLLERHGWWMRRDHPLCLNCWAWACDDDEHLCATCLEKSDVEAEIKRQVAFAGRAARDARAWSWALSSTGGGPPLAPTHLAALAFTRCLWKFGGGTLVAHCGAAITVLYDIPQAGVRFHVRIARPEEAVVSYDPKGASYEQDKATGSW